MQLFDSHTHLESPRFEVDRPDVIARARSAGVVRMITCGSDLATSKQGIALAQSTPGLYAAVGIHGHQATVATIVQPSAHSGAKSAHHDEAAAEQIWQIDESVFVHLAELAAQSQVVAIGEIGLDYHYDFSSREMQRAVLARQLALAGELNLPVILHNREADEDTRRLVDAAPAHPGARSAHSGVKSASLRGVLHCFLADLEMAEWALDRGLYIGVAGPITFKNVRYLPQVVRRIPLDRLLIETDCPYLAPHPKRGGRNEPAYVRYVAEKLAVVLGVAVEEIAQRTMENACRLFGVS